MHRANRFFIWASIFILFSVSGLGSVQALEPVKSKIVIGFGIHDTPGGLEIVSIAPNSAAADASLTAGDIIVAVNGQPVKTRKDLQEKIYPTLLPFTPAGMTIQRGGGTMEVTVVPKGFLRFELRDVPPRKFVIPGVPETPASAPKSAIEALDQMNTLKQVIFNPQTGAIELVGTYDDRFATGPIPYLDLLKTALQYPNPAMTIVPTQETKALLAEMRNSKEERRPQAVAQIAINLLLGHPHLERERQALFAAFAKEFGITAEEEIAMTNFFELDNTTGIIPPQIARIQEKLLRNLGYDEVADAFVVLAVNAPGAAEQALGKLGKSPGEYPGNITLQAYFALQEKLINKTVQWAIDKKDEINKGDQLALLIQQQRRLRPEWDKSRKKMVTANVLTKLLLSDEASRILGNIPRPVESTTIAKELDPSSQLYRIMYEADYAMKSRDTFPELFAEVPGSMNRFEYMAMTATNNRYKNLLGTTRYWLEPRKVDMEFSPDKTVVSFGNAEIRMFSHSIDLTTMKDIDFPDELSPDVNWDGWCAMLSDNYDAYAHVVPSFHRLREAAKMIALARWITAEHIAVNLTSVVQEKWQAPAKVPGFWSYGFSVQFFDEGSGGRLRSWNHSAVGGVSFKAKSNWTSYTPAPVSQTNVSNQLSLSSQLGQKAAQAAVTGSLENAKYLAELSAQAMTGSLNAANLAKMNISVPEVKGMAVSTSSVQLQKEIVKKTYQQINTMIENPTSKGTSAVILNQLSTLYDQARNNPASASDYLVKLQTGQLSGFSPTTPVNQAPQSPSQTPPVEAHPAAAAVCSEKSLGDAALSDARKSDVAQKLRAAREKLQYINTALKNLIAINIKTRAEMEKWTGEIDTAYTESKARAWEAVNDLLLDAAPEALQKNHQEALETIDAVKSVWLKAIASEADPRKVAEIKNGINTLDTLKKSLTDSNQLLRNYQDIKQYYDVDKGNREAKNTFEQLENAGSGIAQLLLNQEFVKKALDAQLRKWPGKNLDFFTSLYTVGKATNYACSFFGDIMRQQFAWKPVMESLQKDLKFNEQAMDKLRRASAQTEKEIGCLEALLH